MSSSKFITAAVIAIFSVSLLCEYYMLDTEQISSDMFPIQVEVNPDLRRQLLRRQLVALEQEYEPEFEGDEIMSSSSEYHLRESSERRRQLIVDEHLSQSDGTEVNQRDSGEGDQAERSGMQYAPIIFTPAEQHDSQESSQQSRHLVVDENTSQSRVDDARRTELREGTSAELAERGDFSEVLSEEHDSPKSSNQSRQLMADEDITNAEARLKKIVEGIYVSKPSNPEDSTDGRYPLESSKQSRQLSAATDAAAAKNKFKSGVPIVKRKKELDEDTKMKYKLNYLGGLTPQVDEEGLPVNLKTVWSEREDSEVAFFWHIPKASGTTMKNIMTTCFGLKRAENIKGEPSMTYARESILNMDTHTPQGLQHAFESEIIDKGDLDVLVSNYFLAGSALFTENHKGRAFTLLRHPIDMAESLFHYRKTASWERAYRKRWKHWKFADYARSEYYMDNWMVRQLNGLMPTDKLDDTHLENAKSIMRKKLLVGLSTQWEETIRQVKFYFGWEDKTPFCSRNYINSKTNANDHPTLERGSDDWNAVAEREKWDLSLYYYALELFSAQGERLRPSKDADGNVVEKKQMQYEPGVAAVHANTILHPAELAVNAHKKQMEYVDPSVEGDEAANKEEGNAGSAGIIASILGRATANKEEEPAQTVLTPKKLQMEYLDPASAVESVTVSREGIMTTRAVRKETPMEDSPTEIDGTDRSSVELPRQTTADVSEGAQAHVSLPASVDETAESDKWITISRALRKQTLLGRRPTDNDRAVSNSPDQSAVDASEETQAQVSLPGGLDETTESGEGIITSRSLKKEIPLDHRSTNFDGAVSNRVEQPHDTAAEDPEASSQASRPVEHGETVDRLETSRKLMAVSEETPLDWIAKHPGEDVNEPMMSSELSEQDANIIYMSSSVQDDESSQYRRKLQEESPLGWMADHSERPE